MPDYDRFHIALTLLISISALNFIVLSFLFLVSKKLVMASNAILNVL